MLCLSYSNLMNLVYTPLFISTTSLEPPSFSPILPPPITKSCHFHSQTPFTLAIPLYIHQQTQFTAVISGLDSHSSLRP